MPFGFPISVVAPYPIYRHEPFGLSLGQNTSDIHAVYGVTSGVALLPSFLGPFAKTPQNPLLPDDSLGAESNLTKRAARNTAPTTAKAPSASFGLVLI